MLENIKNQLIISCQALIDEPLHGADIMAKMALSVTNVGIKCIRANGIDDINAIKKVTNAYVIGLIKQNYDYSDVYITPTIKEVNELINSSCDIIAIDATIRERPNKEKLVDLVETIKKSSKISLADISTFEEGEEAIKMGFDLVSTTLSGYTSYSRQSEKVDFKLIKKLCKKYPNKIIAEGRISCPKDLKKVLKYHPFAVVIGGAVTRPAQITKRFLNCYK